MARINDGVLKDWLDGSTVKATEYKQEREILRVAINDNNDRLGLAETNITNRYTKAETDSQIAILAGGSGSVDGGSFLDTYENNFLKVDGGEF